jgi:hypothetical protein
MNKFNSIIYDQFKLNITRAKTIAGLSFLIYTSSFYDKKELELTIINEKLDKFIREGFYGGVVDVCERYYDSKHYKYDSNSHYPASMKQKMPGGKPRLSSEKNLDKIFGFVRATVEAPSEKKLKVAILPCKIDNKTELFRGVRTGVWFTEELKYARDCGYIVKDIHVAVVFDEIEGVFDRFVDNIYQLKMDNDANFGKRFIFKLILNSLFGRLGILKKNLSYDILSNEKLMKLQKKYVFDVLYSVHNLNFIQKTGLLEPELVYLLKNEKLVELNKKEDNKISKLFNNDLNNLRNISSVQYSAAITAYGRILINDFKNLENNKYIGGDTDSIIMAKPLENKFVGKDLGKFKLECVIDEGFYYAKKSYLIKLENGEVIVK